MASESTEESSVEVPLEPAVEEWLDARARDLDVDRETVLLRLLASHRAVADREDGAGLEELAADVAETTVLREAVDAAIAERLDRAVAETVEQAAEDAVAETLERLDETDDALESRLQDQIQTVQADFRTKLEDVRERVVQLKRETDGKAPADHDHEELARVDALGERVHSLEDAVADLEAELRDLEDVVSAADSGESEVTDALTDDVEALQDRLKTVAWVVSDLREAYESGGDSASLERLKQSAAAADAARAACERCGKGVEIALLTEPTCPHCDATVTEVEPGGRFFGSATLRAASQLESGGD